MMNRQSAHSRVLATLFIITVLTLTAFGQTTAFTYQGQLSNNGAVANGSFDLQFALFNLVQNGSQQGGTVVLTNVPVVNGIFTVQLDFGSNVFISNAAQFMEIGVRPGGTSGAFTILSPRVPVTPTPYSIRTISAASADNATQLGGVAAAQYVQTTDSRLSDSRTPLPNSPNYIQNGTAQQANSNFNISGNGTISGTLSASAVNSNSGYSIGTTSVLNLPGGTNISVGNLAGTGGVGNTFVGTGAGKVATSDANIMVGNAAGDSLTTGGNNSFLGQAAGAGTTTGHDNTFVGLQAGINNVTGSNNTFIGSGAGSPNGSNLTQSAAIGANASVTTNNTIVLGTATETTKIPGAFNVTGLSVFGTLGGAGSTTVCRNASNQLSTCSSSLRYKTDLTLYNRGLDIIGHLRPITFTWKDGGMRDLGFGAEDVAKIEPLLVTYNQQGQVEGLKYDRITTALVNAVNEQQTQITSQHQQITEQQKQIDSLKRLVCADHPGAEVCKQ
ncbi:MAG TPA: tail fiber domain-containing protein [Blastocatellia bacterium]|nr:tail fiber domain-containing protein [Blastocatellia bacterium]